MSTMRDVAARAGVSAKTVSRVFRDDPHVLPETRERVEQAMRDLHYVPNAMATTFRSGQAAVIGVAVPNVVDPFFASIIRAVDLEARRHRLSTLVANLGYDAAAERETVETLLSRRLAGLIIVPVSTDHAWLERWSRHVPIVFVDRPPLNLRADSFTEDDEGGGFLATTHLAELGHRRIAAVADLAQLHTEIRRLSGYRRGLEASGLEPDDALVRIDVADRESARSAVDRLRALPDPPTAIFSVNARSSMALASALRDDPMAMVGFGDFPTADLVRPSLTVIDQNPDRLGRLAAQRIFDRIEHPDRRYRRTTVLDISLVVRESSSIR